MEQYLFMEVTFLVTLIITVGSFVGSENFKTNSTINKMLIIVFIISFYFLSKQSSNPEFPFFLLMIFSSVMSIFTLVKRIINNALVFSEEDSSSLQQVQRDIPQANSSFLFLNNKTVVRTPELYKINKNFEPIASKEYQDH